MQGQSGREVRRAGSVGLEHERKHPLDDPHGLVIGKRIAGFHFAAENERRDKGLAGRKKD